DHQVSVFRIRVDLSFVGTVAAGHRMVLWSLSLVLQACSFFRLGLGWLWFCSAGSMQNDPSYLSRYTWVIYLGRFAPYLERRCFRFFTPCVSRTPRKIW